MLVLNSVDRGFHFEILHITLSMPYDIPSSSVATDVYPSFGNSESCLHGISKSRVSV